jgi:hypothetical protein
MTKTPAPEQAFAVSKNHTLVPFHAAEGLSLKQAADVVTEGVFDMATSSSGASYVLGATGRAGPGGGASGSGQNRS